MVQAISAAVRVATRAVHRVAIGEMGAVSAEYGLLLTLIALAIILAAIAFSAALVGLFEEASSSFPTT